MDDVVRSSRFVDNSAAYRSGVLEALGRCIASPRTGGAARLAARERPIHVDVTHVKPHGALNNVACVDADVAAALPRGSGRRRAR